VRFSDTRCVVRELILIDTLIGPGVRAADVRLSRYGLRDSKLKSGRLSHVRGNLAVSGVLLPGRVFYRHDDGIILKQ